MNCRGLFGFAGVCTKYAGVAGFRMTVPTGTVGEATWFVAVLNNPLGPLDEKKPYAPVVVNNKLDDVQVVVVGHLLVA